MDKPAPEAPKLSNTVTHVLSLLFVLGFLLGYLIYGLVIVGGLAGMYGALKLLDGWLWTGGLVGLVLGWYAARWLAKRWRRLILGHAYYRLLRQRMQDGPKIFRFTSNIFDAEKHDMR